ncbi:hypothetical protein [Candidatus Poriferisocius sp.]|uniref:hypothetical protein n=1 Tax=Candidatus Poriferisocius sp. TaxID=3101276 RepID=UPI003B018477
MHTSIVLLSLGMAVAVITGSLSDHAELIANRNMAAARAERALAAFVDGCGSTGCNSATVNTTRLDGTVLSGCISHSPGGTILRVKARVPWSPTVFTGLSPSTATSAVELHGLGAAAAIALAPC